MDYDKDSAYLAYSAYLLIGGYIMAQLQSKEFMLIIYDTFTLEELMLYSRDNDNLLNYAYCYHDNDNKKSHYHLLLQFKKKVSISVISKIFNVPENLIEVIRSWSNSVRYLIHYDNKDKYQYKFESIVSNFDVKVYFNEISFLNESDTLLLLISYIEEKKPRLKDLLLYVIDNNYLSIYKKYYILIKDVAYFSNKDYNYNVKEVYMTMENFKCEVKKGVSKKGGIYYYAELSCSGYLITKVFLKDTEVSLLKILKVIKED